MRNIIEYGTEPKLHGILIELKYNEQKIHLAPGRGDLIQKTYSTPCLQGIQIEFKTKATPPSVSFSNILATPNKNYASISWDTNTATTSYVKYGTSVNNLNLISNEFDKVVLKTSGHFVVINGLKSNTMYFYQCCGEDANGNEYCSLVKSFRTLL